MRPSFFHHLHPPTIPEQQARGRYTLGAGGLAVFLTLVVIASGTLELFYYIPTPERAGESIQTLTYLVPYGGLVRNLHYWAAQGLVVTALLHLMRVIFTGAYAQHRHFNYLLGLCLLVLILLSDFSGYMLRWDEGVRWALVAGTNLLKSIPLLGPPLYRMVIGGEQPGAATLTRFYAWHLFGLSLALIGTGIWHLFRVRRDGGIAVPPPHLRQDTQRITRFELVRREALAAFLCLAALILIASYFPAPLAAPMSAQIPLEGSAHEAGAPWFFLWVQQLLRLGDPFWMGVVVPVLVLALLAGLPYLLPNARPHELGRWWPAGNRLAQGVAAFIALVVLGLTLLALIR